MNVATWLVLPVPHPDLARLQLGAEARVELGLDFVALHCEQPFSEVAARRMQDGLVAALPVALRVHFDPRGVLALPDVGQSLALQPYEALASDGVWLPLRSTAHLLLVPLSPRRAEMLRDEPDLVREIVDAGVDDALELGPPWVEYRRTLAELARCHGLAPARIDALPPAGGVALYEDATIELARLIEPHVVADLSSGLAGVRCPAELAPVQSFYRRTAKREQGLLAVCFRR